MIASASEHPFRWNLLVLTCVLLAVLLAPFRKALADPHLDRKMTESSQPSFALNGNVSAVPAAPELIGPTGATTTHRPTYQWKKVNDANRYHLSIYLPELKKVILNVKLGNGICSEETCSYTPKVNFVNRPYKFKVRSGNAAGWGPYSLWMNYQVAANQDPAAIIVDHTCTDISKIPMHWLEEARKITFHFAHTSHGSQIITGLAYWNQQAAKIYNFAVKYDPPGLPLGTDRLKIYDGNNYGGDNYITPEMYWNSTQGVNKTKSVSNTGLFDYSMWSWCGQQSGNSLSTVQKYLDTLDRLDVAYPQMRFILMTGHTDGGSGTLTRNNGKVWNYAAQNGKALFDFADIEQFDPAGNYYPKGNDACTWCDAWCQNHPDDCQDLPSNDSECAHSHGYMCKAKGKAFWWMMARLAGWDGKSAD